MLKKLREHWGVNGLNLLLIICTFALGGSLCGYIGRKLLALTSLEKGILWIVLYIVLITILWPITVLLVSIPLGQFSFFKKYIKKVLSRFSRSSKSTSNKIQPHLSASQQGMQFEEIGVAKNSVINIAIFASGSGSNAQQIINYFSSSASIKIALVVCNNEKAGVLQIATKADIPYLLIEKELFFNGDCYLPKLQKQHINFIVLAGFLWKLPEALIKVYPKRIINIHPALLPKYGGAGMYGHRVHEAVVSNKEKESGITIHYVDELYDHGEIIFQATCKVDENDTAETLAKKVLELEHANYSTIIEGVVKSILFE
jgi:formyltetrahydrofolate-dependent phosphoribosylglycinamide formyltransferase